MSTLNPDVIPWHLAWPIILVLFVVLFSMVIYDRRKLQQAIDRVEDRTEQNADNTVRMFYRSPQETLFDQADWDEHQSIDHPFDPKKKEASS